MIPIARPDVGQEEIAAVTEVLQSGMLAQGKKVKELEDRWAAFVGVKHAIATGNGTLALMSIFTGIGLEPGDEVITVSHTFAATANAILSTGATPVFVDIEPDTYLIEEVNLAVLPVPQLLPELLDGQPKADTPRSLLLVGGVDFDGEPGKHDGEHACRQEPQYPRGRDDGAEGGRGRHSREEHRTPGGAGVGHEPPEAKELPAPAVG